MKKSVFLLIIFCLALILIWILSSCGGRDGVSDILVHDRNTTSTTRVSASTDGTQGNNASSAPSISSDGRYVAFESAANNLIAVDTNGAIRDIFVIGPLNISLLF